MWQSTYFRMTSPPRQILITSIGHQSPWKIGVIGTHGTVLSWHTGAESNYGWGYVALLLYHHTIRERRLLSAIRNEKRERREGHSAPESGPVYFYRAGAKEMRIMSL